VTIGGLANLLQLGPASAVAPHPRVAAPPPAASVTRQPACDCGNCAECAGATLELSPAASEALSDRSAAPAGPTADLTAEQQREVEQLKERDREVRQHEQAHLAAAGPYAQGAPQYEFQRGPDGRSYAVGGEVSIDTSAVAGDPEATIRKMQQLQAAANAPAEPSGQDRQVAAKAAQQLQAARAELAEQRQAPNSKDAASIGGGEKPFGEPAPSAAANRTEQSEAAASRSTGQFEPQTARAIDAAPLYARSARPASEPGRLIDFRG
jgi:hypothetical protein